MHNERLTFTHPSGWLPALLALALTVCLPVSCQKDIPQGTVQEEDVVDVPEPEDEELQEEMCTVEFSIDSPDTKMTGISSTNETAINRWVLYIYDSSGSNGKAPKVSSNGSNISVSITPGTYQVCAVVNYANSGSNAFNTSSTISSKSTLESKVSYLADNAYNSLFMYGSAQFTFTAGSNGTKQIPVTRLVSRLGVSKVTVNMAKPSDAAQTFILKGIYATNVAARCTFGSDYGSSNTYLRPSNMYNAFGWMGSSSITSPAAPTALLGEPSINATISNGSSHTTAHYMYVYPNASTSDSHSSSTSTVRNTRIVIEATLGGVTYYYLIPVPGIVRNNTYTASQVTITGPGALDPELDSPAGLTVTFDTNIQDWSTTPISETS